MRNVRTWMYAALGGLLAGCGGHAPAARSAQPAVQLTTAVVGTYVERVAAVGRVGAPAGSESKLAFAENGVLASVDVHVGDRVAAGQPLAQLDTGGLSLAAQQAQSDARAAVAAAHQAEIDRLSTKIAVDRAALRRAQSLYAAGVSPLKDVQTAQAQLASDRADAAMAQTQIASAQAQEQSAKDRAALAQRDLDLGTLRAPADGVVTAIYKQPGEAVDPTTPAIAIGPGRPHEVTLDVASADAARVRAGDPVALSVTGTGLHSRGRVTGVSASLDPGTQTAMVVVDGAPAGAPAGSAIQATIDVGTARGIVVPQTAVVQDPQSGDTLVFVETRGKDGRPLFEQRNVVVAQQDGTRALIASGLRPGERIATQGGFALLAPAGGGD